MHTPADWTTAALLAILVVLLGVIGLRAWRNSRISPDDRERRRRLILMYSGKLGDADLVEIQDNLLIYSYAVRGVVYTAAQDISKLQAFLPLDLSSLGRIAVKFDPRNPANSIVLAEEWSGLAATPAPISEPGR